MMLLKKFNNRLDHLGMLVSLLCAVHCALLPLAITMLPLLGLEFLAHPAIELGIISLSLIIGLVSMGRSWFKHHRIQPSIFMLFGFAAILTGHLFIAERWEWIFLTLGGFAIVIAHYQNWRLLHTGNRNCEINHK